MAKGSAKEQRLGSLHAKITEVFLTVLDRYEQRMNALDNIDTSEIEDEMLRELMDDGALPNPAMLSAITKFLKDNDIGFDTERMADLSDQERRLKERREKRGTVVSLTDLSAMPEASHG